MSALIEVLSWVFIIGGSAFCIIGAFGVVSMSGFWLRLHAASVAESAGMLLLITGMCLQAGFSLITAKLIVMAIFLLITGPTATYAVARAALSSGLKPPKLTARDAKKKIEK